MIFPPVGIRVTEVAHDFQVGVMKYVTEELGILNSYDTWHGMCNNIKIQYINYLIMIFL